jgi:hypothetical protein
MYALIGQIFKNYRPLFLTLIGLDLLAVLLHLIFSQQTTFFHLDYERNLPTLYQSGKLILFGLIFFSFGLRKKLSFELKTFVIPLSIFITFLGFDELLQIHENIYRIFELFDWFHPSRIVEASMRMGYRSSLWILYYLPGIFIFVFWSGYWLRYFQSRMKANFWIIAFSSLCFFTVLITEILSSTGSYSVSSYFWLVTLEETAEMFLATTLILVGNKVLYKLV